MFTLFSTYRLYFLIGLGAISLGGGFFSGYKLKSTIDEAAAEKQMVRVINQTNKDNQLAYDKSAIFESQKTNLQIERENLNEDIYKNESSIDSANVISNNWLCNISKSMSSLPSPFCGFNGQSTSTVTPTQELIKETNDFLYCGQIIIQLNTLIDEINEFKSEDEKNNK